MIRVESLRHILLSKIIKNIMIYVAGSITRAGCRACSGDPDSYQLSHQSIC